MYAEVCYKYLTGCQVADNRKRRRAVEARTEPMCDGCCKSAPKISMMLIMFVDRRGESSPYAAFEYGGGSAACTTIPAT